MNNKTNLRLSTKLLLAILICLLMVSCSSQQADQDKSPSEKDAHNLTTIDQTPSIIDSDSTSTLTASEFDYIGTLQVNGFITMATLPNKLTYNIEENGEITGFHYELIKTFVDKYDLELRVIECEFSDFFKLNGLVPSDVETDPQRIYTPDLFNEADLYLANLAILPWREKLMQFIKVIPSKELVVTRKGETLESIHDFPGKKIAVGLNTSHHATMLKIQAEIHTDLTFVHIDDYYSILEKISVGEVDVTVFDSDRLFYEIEAYDNLDVSMTLSELQNLSWAVSRDNDLLASLLRKHIAQLKANGTYNLLWKKYYHVDINDYLKIIGAE